MLVDKNVRWLPKTGGPRRAGRPAALALPAPTDVYIPSMRVSDWQDQGSRQVAGSSGLPAESQKSEQLKNTVAQIMSRESADGPWSARDGMCLDLAAKWHERLKREGIESHIASVDPSLEGQTLPLHGKIVHGKFHAFLVLGEGKDQIILDGSVQQFFDGPEKRDDLPSVFIGSPDELRTLFSQHVEDLRLEVVGDQNIGRYPPHDLANFAYGMGPYERSRELLN